MALDARRAVERLLQLMRSRRFRRRYMKRVRLTPMGGGGDGDDGGGEDGGEATRRPRRFHPLMPPDFCDDAYRRHAARVVRAVRTTTATLYGFPECLGNPYRRDMFLRALTFSAAGGRRP